MFPIVDIALMVMSTFIQFLFHPVFWVVILLVFYQYKRISQMEEKLFGRPMNHKIEQTVKSLLLGAVGGLLASGVLVLLGVSLDRIGILYIWPVAILLLFINPRFLCFAYAGGIVSVGVFIARFLAGNFTWLADNRFIAGLMDIYLPGLLVLVAVLHLAESLLIYIGGHWGSSPVYIKGPGGEVLGGFSLQRFWPVPLVGMIAMLQKEAPEMSEGAVSMPDWWPILNSGIEPLASESLMFLLFPVVAGLGYADLALSSTPREKSIISARFLSIYSVVLLLLALFSEFYPPVLVPACLFAPLGHELVVHLGNRFEFSRSPRYSSPDKGVMVLAVYPDSAASAAGLQAEDIIEKVNGEEVINSHHLWQLIFESYFLVHLTVRRKDEVLTLVLKRDTAVSPVSGAGRRQSPMGLILVPDTKTSAYVELKKNAFLDRLKGSMGRNK